jgi:hypothetical protein
MSATFRSKPVVNEAEVNQAVDCLKKYFDLPPYNNRGNIYAYDNNYLTFVKSKHGRETYRLAKERVQKLAKKYAESIRKEKAK